jgi:hypothetical protein
MSYSYRSATIGSTFVARRVGRKLANRATVTSTPAASSKVRALCGFSPKSKCCTKCVIESAARVPPAIPEKPPVQLVEHGALPCHYGLSTEGHGYVKPVTNVRAEKTLVSHSDNGEGMTVQPKQAANCLFVTLIAAKLHASLPLRFRTREPLSFQIVGADLHVRAELFIHFPLETRSVEHESIVQK